MVSIHVDGEYRGTASITLLTGRAFVPNIDKLKPGQIVRARVDGELAVYRVERSSLREVHLASKRRRSLGKFYLGGPMRGYDHYNFPAFLMAASHLKALGFEIVDPASHDLEGGLDVTRSLEEQGFDIKGALGWDFTQIVQCDGVILLDGWEKSSGAKAERLVGEMTGKQILRLNAKLELFAEDDWTSELTWSKS